MSERFLTAREARGLYGVSRATWDRAKKRTGFPRPVVLGARCFRWRESELVAYAEASQGSAAPAKSTNLEAARVAPSKRA